MRIGLFSCLALLLGLWGCHTPLPGDRGADDELRRLANALGEPYPVRVAVSTISIDGRPSVDFDAGYRFPGDPAPPHPDPAIHYPFMAGQELSAWMTEFLSDPAVLPFAEIEQYDITPPQLAEALGNPSDLPILRLNLRLNDLEVRFAGRNRFWAPKVALWTLLIFPSLPVAGEDYTARIDFDVIFTDFTDPGRVVFQAPILLEVPARLDDFDRGWQPLGVFRAPDNLAQWNWDRILERITPIALREMEKELLIQLADGFEESLREWMDAPAAPMVGE